MRIVAGDAGQVDFAVLAHLPLEEGLGVACAAQSPRPIRRHRLVGVIRRNWAVARFTGDSLGEEGVAYRIVAGGVAGQACAWLAAGAPFGQGGVGVGGLPLGGM